MPLNSVETSLNSQGLNMQRLGDKRNLAIRDTFGPKQCNLESGNIFSFAKRGLKNCNLALKSP